MNFRFHVVSLVAVFLALSLGIGMGATVIDKATVDQLQQRLESVRNEVQSANQRSDELQRQLNRSSDYQRQTSEYLIDERLRGVDVVVVAVRGIDETPVAETRELLKAASASVKGTLWFTGRSALTDPATVASLQQGLDTPNAGTDQLRQAVLARVSAAIAGATPPSSLEPLVDAGVIEWQGEADNTDLSGVDLGGAKVVVASGAQPAVPNDTIAIPLVRLLSAQPARRVVAVESGREADARTSAERAVFLGPVRNDSDVDGKISTVDNIETLPGRIAVVLALWQLPDRVGDYGVGSNATSLIPPPPS